MQSVTLAVTGAAASSAAERAAAAEAAAAGIVADVERRLQASSQPGPEGGLKALSLPAQVSSTLLCIIQHESVQLHTCNSEHQYAWR